ncbi:hypothetical protein Goarm_023398 [Gossypium armourianum]|uniref:Uncharacterized protein n=1 Tax=Gossypium armourianum TaxID=34283 RepID=A0A7J9KH70_9ROSI|nr:hypothetical protein [Gossypium armourianum]
MFGFLPTFEKWSAHLSICFQKHSLRQKHTLRKIGQRMSLNSTGSWFFRTFVLKI